MIEFAQNLKKGLMDRWDRSTPIRRLIALSIWASVLFITVNWRNYLNDFTPLALIPVAVLREGNVSLNSFREYVVNLPPGQKYTFVESGNLLYPMKPIAVSLLTTPAFLPPVLAGVQTQEVDFWVGWGRLVNAMLVGFSVGLCFHLATFWTTVRGALFISIALAFGTGVWTQVANCLNYHAGAFFVTALILLGITNPSGQRTKIAFGIGTLFCLAIAMRPTTVVYLLPLGFVYFFDLNGRSKLFVCVGAMCGSTIPFGLNILMFGHPLSTGYSPEEIDRWSTPFLEGFVGQFFAPNSGLLIQSPFLFLCLFGWVRKSSKWMVISAIGFLMYVAFFSKWYDWQGGLSFAARMLTDAYPLLIPILAQGWNAVRNHRKLRRLIISTVIAAIGFQIIGIAWFDSISALDPPHRPWSLEAHFYWVALRNNGPTWSAFSLSKTVLLFVLTAIATAWILNPLLISSQESESRIDEIQASPPDRSM